jgi:CRP-like cAMP-binding protein
MVRMPTLTDPAIDVIVDVHGVARRDATKLANAATTIAIEPGRVLCRQGERGLEAFLLVSGEAVVHTVDGPVTLRPGAVFGELAALDARRVRNATVVVTQAADVAVFDVRTFRALAETDPFTTVLVPSRAA